MSQFLASMDHELLTPLNAVIGFARGGSFAFDNIKGSGTTIRIAIPQPPVPMAVSTLPSA